MDMRRPVPTVLFNNFNTNPFPTIMKGSWWWQVGRMPMLSFKQTQGKPIAGGYSQIYDGTDCICNHESWMLRCCGMSGLSNLNNNVAWWTKENIDRLCIFLKKHKDDYSSYIAEELYISLSTSQVQMFQPLVNDTRMKLVDRYLNKAHGPADIFMYRLSLSEDFKKVPK
jgi:hypothetical protein